MQILIDLVNEHVGEEYRRTPLLTFLGNIESELISAPASSKLAYHHAYSGGLLQHILETFEYCCNISEKVVPLLRDRFVIGADDFHTELCVDKESILFVSILHDIHKVVDYSGRPQYENNILKSGAQSEKIPYKVNKDCFSFRDIGQSMEGYNDSGAMALSWLISNDKLGVKNGGLKSLALLAEAAPDLLATLTPYELDAIEFHGGAYETSKFELAGTENPLTILFHCADMLSSRHGTSS